MKRKGTKVLKNKRLVLWIVVLSVVLVSILVGITIKNGKYPVPPEKLEKLGIDPNHEAYRDKKIYQQKGTVVIESKNGEKSTITESKNSKYKELSEEESKKYKISNVTIQIEKNTTIVTGSVTNTTKKDHEIIVSVKFYDEKNRIKGSNSKKLKLSSKENKKFKMDLMGDLSKYRYITFVEYED